MHFSQKINIICILYVYPLQFGVKCSILYTSKDKSTLKTEQRKDVRKMARQKVWNSVNEMVDYYDGAEIRRDDGAAGKTAESIVNKALKGRLDVVHPDYMSDVQFKHFTIEVKTGAGWLMSPVYDTKEDAINALRAAGNRMIKSQFVAYADKFDRRNPESLLKTVRILSSRKFCQYLIDSNGLVIKQKSPASANHNDGARYYGIAIQSNRKCKFWGGLYDLLDSDGMTIDQFIDKYLSK